MMERLASLRQQFLTRARWLTVGLGVKRWLLLLGVGAGILGMGVVYLILTLRRAGWLPVWLYNILTLQDLPIWVRVLLPVTLGTLVMLVAISRLSVAFLAPFRQPGEVIIDSLYHYSQRQRGPAIVAIGGGHGLATLLRGLREHTNNITAIITVADDGGSSGRCGGNWECCRQEIFAITWRRWRGMKR